MLFSFTSGHYKGLCLLKLYAFGLVNIRSFERCAGWLLCDEIEYSARNQVVTVP